MTDYIWPTSVIPQRSEITLRALCSRFVSPFTGTARTYSRPGGELLSMRLDLPPLTAAKSAALRGMVAKLRGGVNRVWCRDHSYVKRGSFPATELIANNTFANGTTSWLAQYSTITVADGVLRLTVSSHTGGQYPQAIFTPSGVVSGGTYLGRAFFQHVSNPAVAVGPYVQAGTNASSSYSTSYGLKAATALADAASGVFSVVYQDTAATSDTFDIPYTSYARCALVKGASQTGARILIDALPTSSDGLLLEGDQVQIGDELFIVAAPLNSNGSGEGYLTLHRPVRTSPADNAPVIIHEPMGLFMLAENENGWENVPGRFTNASVSLIEAVR